MGREGQHVFPQSMQMSIQIRGGGLGIYILIPDGICKFLSIQKILIFSCVAGAGAGHPTSKKGIFFLGAILKPRCHEGGGG